MNISVVAVTARAPARGPVFVGHPEWSVFDPILRSLGAQQSAPPFELIFVDALSGSDRHVAWEDASRCLSCPVRRIPCKENCWHPQGLPALSAQVNTGVEAARGELILNLDETCLLPPWLLCRIWEEYQKGVWPVLWFLYDFTFGPQRPVGPHGKVGSTRGHLQPAAPVPYNLFGYQGTPAFVDARQRDVVDYTPPWQFVQQYTAFPKFAWKSVGGFDESFDGQLELQDVDFASRLDLAGHGSRFRIVHDLFAVRVPTPLEWGGPIRRVRDGFLRENRALLDEARKTGRCRARTGLPT